MHSVVIEEIGGIRYLFCVKCGMFFNGQVRLINPERFYRRYECDEFLSVCDSHDFLVNEGEKYSINESWIVDIHVCYATEKLFCSRCGLEGVRWSYQEPLNFSVTTANQTTFELDEIKCGRRVMKKVLSA